MVRAIWLLAVVLVGCAAGSAWAKPQTAPLVAKLDGPASVRPGQTITVKLIISRTVVDKLPIAVQWQIPEGAKVVGRAPPGRIVDGRSNQLRQAIRLRFAAVPDRDLLATVEVKGEAYGVSAKAAYRFGRPAPTLPDATHGAPDIKVNGKTLGTGVPLK